MEQQKEYTGVWIPAFIMEDGTLPPMAKLLYAEVASFRICFATNQFFADRLGITVRTVQNHLLLLAASKYVISEDKKGRRYLIPVRDENNFTPPRKKLHGGVKKVAHIDKQIDTNEKEKHTSTLRDDDTVSLSPSLPASSSAGVGKKDGSEASAARAEHLKKVFEVLVTVLHPGQKILYTPKRKAHLNARLENFKPSQLVEAARNLMQDPWNTGSNPTNKKYADFDFLTRSDEQVEKWLNAKPVSKPKSAF